MNAHIHFNGFLSGWDSRGHKPVKNFLPKQLPLEKYWLVTNVCHNGFNKLMIMIKKTHNHGVSWVQGGTHHAGLPGKLCWKGTF